MARFYSNPQLVLSAKPNVNPPEGFVEIFADLENSGRLTYLFPDGSTADVTPALNRVATSAPDEPQNGDIWIAEPEA